MSAVLDHVATLPPGNLAVANRQIRCEGADAESRRLHERRARARLSIIDQLITAVEERNLRGPGRVDHAVRHCLGGLEARVGVAVPRRVLRAPSTTRLHDELLDWKETLRVELGAGGSRAAG